MRVICHECGVEFEKPDKEVRRQMKKGREHFFCSLRCVARYGNKIRHNTPDDGLKSYQRRTKKMEDVLGEKLSTAKSRLNKLITFYLAQKCGMDICYRCGKRIESIEEFSIDHRESWKLSNDPQKYFYDMENIAFSHLQCNSEAGIMNSGLLVKEDALMVFYQ